MSFRKKPKPKLDRWSQLRRRGPDYLVMGRYTDGDVFCLSIHESLDEAREHARAYERARLRDSEYYFGVLTHATTQE